jgi:hypothetical protein
MITTPLLAALLAMAPVLPGGAAPTSAPHTAAAPADEKVTLNLKDADLTKVLENFATLIGVTPIIAPGVGGTVTLEAHASIPELLRDLERSFQITIRIADGRMFVSKAAEPPSRLDDDAADLRYLANVALPRRPTAAAPKRFDGDVEIRASAGESRIYSLASAGGVTIPGCPSGLAILPLPGDRFDGLPGLVLKGEGILPRVLSLSLDEFVPVELPGCPGPISLRLQPSSARAIAPVPLRAFGQFQIQLQILDVGAHGETVLSAPRVQVEGGEPATMQSGTTRRSSSGIALMQTVQAALAVVDASEEQATVALSSAVLRDVDPKDGGSPVTIRIARARESARLAFGKAQRIVLSPTFGRGDSALVLDVMIERAPERR